MGGIFFLALLAAVVHFSVWNNLSELAIPLSQVSFGSLDPWSPFTGQAVSLTHTGTFNYSEPGYIGLTQRGPVYASIVAVGLLLFGERASSVLLVNIFLLFAALFFLWRISKQFLSGWWAFLPSLLLGVYWEVSTFVAFGSYEMFALAMATFSVWSFFHYRDTRNIWWLVAAGCGVGAWVLEKPILILSVPFFVIIVIAWQWSRLNRRTLAIHIFLFIALVGVIIGVWSQRNYRVLGTRELGTGGVILLRRASQVDFTPPELISMGLSFAVGDYVGAKLYSAFPRENGLPAEPKTWDPAIERRLETSHFYGFDKEKGFHWIVTDLDGTEMTRVKFDARLKEEAIMKIKKRPVKFFLVGFLNLLRLNAPINYGSQEIMHVFVGAHDSIPPVGKIGIILILRGIWYAFLALVLYGIVRHAKDWQTWGLIAFVALYYNGMYAFFTHAEVRYILTAMPFYLIFFTDSLQLFYETYSARRA